MMNPRTSRLAGLLAIAAAFLAVAHIGAAEAKRPPVNVIFDCDMGNDCDDAGALALLHALADDGEANILACMMWKMRKDEPVSGPAAVIDVINTYYGRPDIPIGIGKKGLYVAGAKNYTNTLGREFPNDTFGKSIDDFPEAIDLYRRVLAAQPDRSVAIVCVGPHTSVKHLLASGADGSSPLSGRELVAQKVALLSLMGGRFPEGDEFNLGCDLGGSMAAALEWPGRVVWSGLEIGGPIVTGPGRIRIPEGSPLHAAYKPYGGQRQSWDLTSVLVAVRGPGEFWGLSEARGHYCVVPSKSIPGYTHHWEGRSIRDQTYLRLKRPAAEVATAIDGLLEPPPTRVAASATGATGISVAWPTRVVYAGREIGLQIGAGAPLARQRQAAEPVSRFFTAGRPQSSAGMAAILYGVRGAGSSWDDTATGACYIQPSSGGTRWLTDLTRDQAYLTAKMPPSEIEKKFNQLIARPPARP